MAGSVGTTSMMINAALIAMTSTMTGQLAGGASFDEAFQAGIKAGATSAITAGILNAQLIDTAPGMQSINQLANVQTTGANIVGNFNADTFGQNLLGIGARGVVNAGVNTAINGGSFGDAFKSSVIGDLAAVGANAVGQGTNALSPGNILGHAAIGCAAAAATGKDCASGAIGGAGAAVVNPLLDQAIGGADGSGWGSNPETAQQWQTATLQLGSMAVSAATAAALGKDGMTAALAAQNETVNNYLTKNQIDQKKKDLSICQSVAECKTVEDKWKTIDRKQTAEAQACLANGTCGSVMMTADTIKQIRDELQQTCTAFCSADALASLKELNTYFLSNGDVNLDALRTGNIDFGKLAKAGISLAGSVAGVGTGVILTATGGALVLAPEPTGVSKAAGALTTAVGISTVADSGYGVYSNAVNLYRATQGSVVYLPDSGTGRLADWLAPGSQPAQDFAQISSLSLALLSGRVQVGTTLIYGDSPLLAQYAPATINRMLDVNAATPTGALRTVLIPNTNPGSSIGSSFLNSTQFFQGLSVNYDYLPRLLPSQTAPQGGK
jgi:filamentous hemagglutinin